MPNDQTLPSAATLALRFSPADKTALVELSRLVQMSQSETLRWLVRETLTAVKKRNAKVNALPFVERQATSNTISPALNRRIGREIREAKKGDLLAKIWLHKNGSLVQTYVLQRGVRR